MWRGSGRGSARPHGKLHHKRRALTRRALDGDRPSVGHSYPTADAETETRSSRRPAARLVHAIEPVEDMRQVLRRDSHTILSNPHFGLSVTYGPSDGHAASRPGGLPRVVPQVQ